MNSVGRSVILAAAGNRATERFMSRYGMRLGASRFVAGESLDQCVAVIRELNRRGFKCNATQLGEAVDTVEGARAAAADYQVLLRRLAQERLNANVALKLTLMGLELSEELAEENLSGILDLGRELGIFVRIDMEQSSHVDATLRIYRSLRQRSYDNVGCVLQSYLYRTPEDLRQLLPLKPNLRLVKGAYLESPNVAHPKKPAVDDAYTELVRISLASAGYTAIATHDQLAIEAAITFSEQQRIPKDRFEFQMLYGVRPDLQASLLARGYTVLVATSFGSHWYPFFMRRLAERPANVLFLLRNLVKR